MALTNVMQQEAQLNLSPNAEHSRNIIDIQLFLDKK